MPEYNTVDPSLRQGSSARAGQEAGPSRRIRIGPRPWRRRLLVGLCWFVALEFILIAPFKFYPGGVLGYPPYAERFVDWGYPAWFRFVVGAAEVLAGVLLRFPRRRFLGAVTIVVILIGAVTTHIINHDPLTASISAPVHLVLSAIIALACWPAGWREPLALGSRGPAAVRSNS